MRTFNKAALAAALLCAPLAVSAQGGGPVNGVAHDPAGVASPGAGYSQGVTAGWQYTPRRQRSVRAGGAAAAGVLIAAAAAATLRRR